MATVNKYIKNNVEDHIIDIGNKVKDVWQQASDDFQIPITISGLPSLGSFSFNNEDSNLMNTNFVIEMLKNNILGFRQFKPSFAHSDHDIEIYKEAVRLVFEIVTKNNDELLSVDSATQRIFKARKKSGSDEFEYRY